MGTYVLDICYLVAAVTFILGLKMLSDPVTARRGNRIAAAGMAVAVLGTILLYRDGDRGLHNFGWIVAGLLIGGVAGVLAAKKVKMTAMPELVSLFNGMGGACAALISISEFGRLMNGADSHGILQRIFDAIGPSNDVARIGAYIGLSTGQGELPIILAGLIIGSVSFAGSVIAWGKLNGRIKDLAFKGQHLINLLLLAVILIAAVYLCVVFTGRSGDELDRPGQLGLATMRIDTAFYLVAGLALAYGVMFVLPIGGADMPVVISLLNSFTGVAAACGGFLYNNMAMLTGGILVGAAGTLLTILMCRAMNRSLGNVLIGNWGGSKAAAAAAAGGGAGKPAQGVYREISLSDAAMVLSYARKVMIVPGYGLAVAQAQHACHELEKLLTEKGVEVKYAIHPVAGRMPGHMNVLLAEADVDYDKLLELEQANEEFPSTDVVVVLGANDVVNPAAKTDPSSPIYGMPILEVELAKACIVNKRSMKPGYAGIENELFYAPKTSMLFGDGKKVLQDLIAAVRNL